MSLNKRPETLFQLIARNVRVAVSKLFQPRFDVEVQERMFENSKNRTFIAIESKGSLGAGDFISDILNHRHPH